MSATELTSSVPFSTPDDHILTEIKVPTSSSTRLSDEEIAVRYEIQNTIDEIRRSRWKRVALQFPDDMLRDSAKVYQILARGLKGPASVSMTNSGGQSMATVASSETILNSSLSKLNVQTSREEDTSSPIKLTILADTSYGSCCVDEVAAEHVDADVVVHYGRTCLSPTSRLPVVYVYTKHELDHDETISAFMARFPDTATKAMIVADTPFSHHVETICDRLKTEHGYTRLFATEPICNNGSLIPNRTLPDDLSSNDAEDIRTCAGDWNVFHISDPPTTLLLTLQSKVKSVNLYSVAANGKASDTTAQVNTAQVLRRRYALVTSLATVSTWGILINTLSVKNYLHIVDHVKKQIAAAGKKSYLFVVGKLNPAKVANFAEIGGWVVIGCWESSLVDSRDFYRPIITPFELDLCLKSDDERIWTGEWSANFQEVLDQAEESKKQLQDQLVSRMPGAFTDEDVDGDDNAEDDLTHDYDSEEESAPPEFDLRTGRYVSRTRPMRRLPGRTGQDLSASDGPSAALTRRANGDVMAVNGVASPAAEFLAQRRTWRGLGSDFELKYEEAEEGGEQGSLIEEGRAGVARGYTIGDSSKV